MDEESAARYDLIVRYIISPAKIAANICPMYGSGCGFMFLSSCLIIA
jgi:hypothetical protein